MLAAAHQLAADLARRLGEPPPAASVVSVPVADADAVLALLAPPGSRPARPPAASEWRRTSILIERFGVLCELHAREVVWPQADPEHAEPQLLVGSRRDRALHHAAARVTAPRLIDDVDPEAAAQENVLVSLAAVRRGLPRFRELTRSVPKHQRRFPRVDRDLVERISVIAAEGN